MLFSGEFVFWNNGKMKNKELIDYLGQILVFNTPLLFLFFFFFFYSLLPLKRGRGVEGSRVENASTNLHPWPHYKHCSTLSIMKRCPGHFASLTFMCNFRLQKKCPSLGLVLSKNKKIKKYGLTYIETQYNSNKILMQPILHPMSYKFLDKCKGKKK